MEGRKKYTGARVDTALSIPLGASLHGENKAGLAVSRLFKTNDPRSENSSHPKRPTRVCRLEVCQLQFCAGAGGNNATGGRGGNTTADTHHTRATVRYIKHERVEGEVAEGKLYDELLNHSLIRLILHIRHWI
ncbi:hypothetical protein J6590_074343 [Homalodisca vitripennis]|nr:hypothetical protein J6590_074343 [Homalodisca vitripennis]